MSDQKALLREDDREAAKMSLEKAKTYYKRGDNVTALKHSIDAMQLDPDNDEITDFVDKVQRRALTK
jgi:Tfp pilus assembly protein PilF